MASSLLLLVAIVLQVQLRHRPISVCPSHRFQQSLASLRCSAWSLQILTLGLFLITWCDTVLVHSCWECWQSPKLTMLQHPSYRYHPQLQHINLQWLQIAITQPLPSDSIPCRLSISSNWFFFHQPIFLQLLQLGEISLPKVHFWELEFLQQNLSQGGHAFRHPTNGAEAKQEIQNHNLTKRKQDSSSVVMISDLNQRVGNTWMTAALSLSLETV